VFQDYHSDGCYQKDNSTIVAGTPQAPAGLICKMLYHELIHRGQSHTPLLRNDYGQIRINVPELYFGNRCEQMAHAGADIFGARCLLAEKDWPLRRLEAAVEKSPEDAFRDRNGLWNTFKFQSTTEKFAWFAGYWNYVPEYWRSP
jgi:hypothetical protein